MLKDPKEITAELVSRVGKHRARQLLIQEGLSTSTAEKLVRGSYPSEIKELVRQAITRAAEKKLAS